MSGTKRRAAVPRAARLLAEHVSKSDLLEALHDRSMKLTIDGNGEARGDARSIVEVMIDAIQLRRRISQRAPLSAQVVAQIRGALDG